MDTKKKTGNFRKKENVEQRKKLKGKKRIEWKLYKNREEKDR